MSDLTPLDYLPLWGLFLVTLAVMCAAAEVGFRIGRNRQRGATHEKDSTVGSIVAATLGLLAFVLAFTFGMAATRFDTRRELLQKEVNAIGTTYLRADFLPGDHGPRVRALLRRYVDQRLEVQRPGVRIAEVIRESERLHGELWAEAVKASRHKDRDPPMVALFAAGLNDVIDLHADRVTAGLRARIPSSIWGALILVSVVTMASVGYYSGLTSTTRSVVGLGMVLCFVLTMLLIADLDRPAEGLLRVNPQGMVDLRESMKGEPP